MSLDRTIARYLKDKDADARERLLSHLNSNRISDEEWPLIPELLAKSPSEKLRCYAWLSLRANVKPSEELCSVLGLEMEQLMTLFACEIRRAFFPVVNSAGGSRLAELLIFTFDNPEPRAIAFGAWYSEKSGLLATLTGKSFLVVFSEDFEGDSWMCAAAAALIRRSNDLLSKLCFSGEVTAAGQINAAGLVEAKKLCCLNNAKRLVTAVDSLPALEFWLSAEALPIPVIQCNGSNEKRSAWLAKLELAIKKEYPWFSLNALWELTGLASDRLFIGEENELPFDPKYWQGFLGRVNNFDLIDQAVSPRKVVFWYASMISSLQFGIGARFGFKRPVCICHWDSGGQEYIPVIKLYGGVNARVLKKVYLDPLELTQISYEAYIPRRDVKDLALVLYFGSHNPRQEAISHMREISDDLGILFVQLKKGQGQITFESDWLRIVQETNSLLNHLKQLYHWNRTHIFQTSPNAICMALGIALGHFVPATVYHYQPQSSTTSYQGMYELEKSLRYGA